MNFVTFFVQAKYLITLFIVALILFLTLSFLITIPGNKRIDAYLIDADVLAEKKRQKKKIIERSLLVLIFLLVIIFVVNIYLCR